MNQSDITKRYPSVFQIKDGCIYRKSSSKNGEKVTRLCNFAPFISVEKTVDDGAEEVKLLTLSGIHADGSVLPEADVSGAELGSFNWLIQKWGAKCILEVGSSVKEYVRYLIQQTAKYAQQIIVFEHTGWKKINGEWHFLLPADERKARAEFQKEARYILLEGDLQVMLVIRLGQRDESQVVGVLGDRLGKPALHGRQRFGEVRLGSAAFAI